MNSRSSSLLQASSLRQRAQSHLNGPHEAANVGASASAALSVLHRLASSPETADQALALLHELQVLQVEIDMQAEDLRSSLAGTEAALHRQIQLHDNMPVACLNIDASTRLLAINETGSRWLGCGRENLLGKRMHIFLSPEGKAGLLARLAVVDGGHASSSWEMILLVDSYQPRTVLAAISADKGNGGYILVMMDKPPQALR